MQFFESYFIFYLLSFVVGDGMKIHFSHDIVEVMIHGSLEFISLHFILITSIFPLFFRGHDENTIHFFLHFLKFFLPSDQSFGQIREI